MPCQTLKLSIFQWLSSLIAKRYLLWSLNKNCPTRRPHAAWCPFVCFLVLVFKKNKNPFWRIFSLKSVIFASVGSWTCRYHFGNLTLLMRSATGALYEGFSSNLEHLDISHHYYPTSYHLTFIKNFHCRFGQQNQKLFKKIEVPWMSMS